MSTGRTRVAVTGVGAVTPVGTDAPSTWRALLAGTPGVATIEADWAEQLPVRIAGLVAAGVQESISPQQRRRMDRSEQLAVIAGREAWSTAGLAHGGADPDRTAVIIGSAIGGLWSTLDQQQRLVEGGSRRVSPHTVTMMMANGSAAWLSMEINARAGARTPVSACASSSEAIMMAREMIMAGSAEVVLAGGTEACVTPLTLSALAQTKALSPNPDAPHASRPFDRGRDGFVLGEGSVVLVLEGEDHARARGADVLAYVEGAALTSDAFDLVAADPENQARTMTAALRSAGVGGTEIDVVHAHATSTRLGDANEAKAIAAGVDPGVAVTSTKSMTGHLLGAAGALGALVAVRSLQDQVIPATTNVATVDPAVVVDVVTAVRETKVRTAMVNAFGFGGHNVTLVLTAS